MFTVKESRFKKIDTNALYLSHLKFFFNANFWHSDNYGAPIAALLSPLIAGIWVAVDVCTRAPLKKEQLIELNNKLDGLDFIDKSLCIDKLLNAFVDGDYHSEKSTLLIKEIRKLENSLNQAITQMKTDLEKKYASELVLHYKVKEPGIQKIKYQLTKEQENDFLVSEGVIKLKEKVCNQQIEKIKYYLSLSENSGTNTQHLIKAILDEIEPKITLSINRQF